MAIKLMIPIEESFGVVQKLLVAEVLTPLAAWRVVLRLPPNLNLLPNRLDFPPFLLSTPDQTRRKSLGRVHELWSQSCSCKHCFHLF